MESDITIIGAGVVGLAAASAVAKQDKNVFVLEKHDHFGEETSSRNSEVLHAGIYYEQGSLKSELCVKGKDMVYRICQENSIDYKRLGKLIVAVNEKEIKSLEELLKKGKANGVDDLRILSKDEVKEIEPNVNAAAALYSPSTGIVDSHNLMRYFERNAEQNGASIVYGAEVLGIEQIPDGYKVTIKDSDGTDSFTTRILINSAGLSSDKIAELAGIDIVKARYKLHYCKGEYFSVGNGKSRMVNSLIYPSPMQNLVGLGLHTVKDLQGMLKIGPSAYYVDDIDYDVNESNRQEFYDSIKEFLPFIGPEDLNPDMAGIRPKLHGPDDDYRDFEINEESDKGFPGLINLIGIESPGLTAAPAIAEYIKKIVEEIL